VALVATLRGERRRSARALMLPLKLLKLCEDLTPPATACMLQLRHFALLLCTLLLGCTSSNDADPELPADAETADASGSDAADSEAPEPYDCTRGERAFDDRVVHEIEITLADSDWAAMIDEAQNSAEYGGPDKTYFQATFTFDGETLERPIGLRLKGHSSLLLAAEQGRSFPFKLDFNRVDDDQEFDGLTKVNLHPNYEPTTVLHELLSYGAIREFGVPTARVSLARVRLNGEDLGVYSLVEQLGGRFVRCAYEEPYGDLYKPEEPVGNLNWLGERIEDYEPEIEFKWPSSSVTQHASLLTLLDVLRSGDTSRFEQVLHVDEVLTYLALNVAVGNYDYYASFGHNYYLYESTPGRFTMVPWDMNFSQTDLSELCGLGRNTDEWPVSHYLLGEPRYVATYLSRMREFLEGPGSVEALLRELDRYTAVLGDVDEGALDELRATIRGRVPRLLAAIDEGIEICPIGGGDDAEDECDACIDAECEGPLDACFDDEPCACTLECVADGEEVETCNDACELTSTPPGLEAVFSCVDARCEASCD
jgi:spore coat protein H